MKEIKWAVLGCGVIANEMAVALQKNGKNIYAVGNRTHEKAVAFAEKYGIGKVYDDFHEMFTDPEVDVIYITTPHNTHLGFMKEAIANGKHILVEKSITLNSEELDEAMTLAKEKGVIIGEAMTIYHMPIYKELKKILDSGRLGRVNLITMNFGSFKEYNMKNRFFNRNLAGGAMLDIGVYALSFIRWFFDSKPDQLLSQVKPAPTGVDEQAGLLLTNQEGQMASVMLSLHSKQPKRGMVSCENGFIEIMEYPRAWEAKITDASTGESEIIKAGDNADALAYELADMERAINGDASDMHLDYTKDVMDLMTEFRRSWGYTYPEEEKFLFRKAQLSEVPAIFDLIKQRIQWLDDHGLRGWNMTDYAARYPLSYYESVLDDLFVLVDSASGDVLSAGVFFSEDERWTGFDPVPAFYLHNFVSCTGAPHVGTKFLQYAEEYARTQGKQYLRLDSCQDNERLTAYYEKLGYLPCGLCDDGPYHGILRQKKL